MKKLYTISLAFALGLSTFVQAQDLSIASVDSYTEENSTYLHEVKAHVTVLYTGTGATYDVARIYNGSLGIADSNYFCWDLCYGVGTDSSNFGGVTLANGDRNSDFYVGWYIKDNSVTAEDSVIFRYYNPSDVNDYLDVTLHLSVSPTVSVVEMGRVTVNAYPNPASSTLNVQVGNLENGMVRLMNLAGQTVSRTSFQNQNAPIAMDVASLPAGVYMLQVMNEGQILNTQRIVVNH